MRTFATLCGIPGITFLTLLLLPSCGGGSGGSDSPPFRLVMMEAPTGEPLALNGILTFHFTAAVREDSVSGDAIVIEAPDGTRARGTFVRGRYLVDESFGRVVVVDPDAVAPEIIDRAERTGDLSEIPRGARYDLGAESDLMGKRRVLFDHSKSRYVTFVPEVPMNPDLSDTAYRPGTEYRIRVVVGKMALRSRDGRRLSSRNGKEYLGTLTTAALDDPHRFVDIAASGTPRVVASDPRDSDDRQPADVVITARFSGPLDPSTLTPDNVELSLVSLPGRPAMSYAMSVLQTNGGTVEVRLRPLADLPPNQW